MIKIKPFIILKENSAEQQRRRGLGRFLSYRQRLMVYRVTLSWFLGVAMAIPIFMFLLSYFPKAYSALDVFGRVLIIITAIAAAYCFIGIETDAKGTGLFERDL